MNKKYIALAILTSLTITMCNAVPSPIAMAKGSWNGVYGGSKWALHELWTYKKLTFFTAAIIASAIIVYESDYVREKIMELLGLSEGKDAKRLRPVPRRSRLNQEEPVEEVVSKSVYPGEEDKGIVKRLRYLDDPQEAEEYLKSLCVCEEDEAGKVKRVRYIDTPQEAEEYLKSLCVCEEEEVVKRVRYLDDPQEAEEYLKSLCVYEDEEVQKSGTVKKKIYITDPQEAEEYLKRLCVCEEETE